MLVNTGTEPGEPRPGLVQTVAWQLGDAAPVYALEGSVFVTGAALQWLRDGLGILADASESEAPRTLARRKRRRLLRPGTDRPRLAALGTGSPRRRQRPHARHEARAPRSRRPRSGRLPGARRARGDGREGRAPAGRRRRRGQRLPHAASGRPRPGPGRSPDRAGDDGARRGRSRRARRRRVVEPRRGRRAWRLRPATSRNDRRRDAERLLAGWRLAVRRARLRD